jgi:hypothetical protein
MSADAFHNLTVTDSDVRLAPAPHHFPLPAGQKLKSAERTRETLARTKPASISESITYPRFYGEAQAKIPFKHVAKTPIKNAKFVH